MAKNNYSIGLILIVIAVILILGKLGVIGFLGSLFWPVFVFLPGILLHVLFFGRILSLGVLVPGGMLVTYSLMFFYCNLLGWHSMTYLWPGFIFGVAVGLYELHIFNRNSRRNTLTAAYILAIISVVLFIISFLFTASIYAIALILIGIGFVIMLRRKRSW
jgi:hypothetical protein